MKRRFYREYRTRPIKREPCDHMTEALCTRWREPRTVPAGQAAGLGQSLTTPALATDVGREHSAVPGTVHVTLVSDELRNLRLCKRFHFSP